MLRVVQPGVVGNWDLPKARFLLKSIQPNLSEARCSICVGDYYSRNKKHELHICGKSYIHIICLYMYMYLLYIWPNPSMHQYHIIVIGRCMAQACTQGSDFAMTSKTNKQYPFISPPICVHCMYVYKIYRERYLYNRIMCPYTYTYTYIYS